VNALSPRLCRRCRRNRSRLADHRTSKQSDHEEKSEDYSEENQQHKGPARTSVGSIVHPFQPFNVFSNLHDWPESRSEASVLYWMAGSTNQDSRSVIRIAGFALFATAGDKARITAGAALALSSTGGECLPPCPRCSRDSIRHRRVTREEVRREAVLHRIAEGLRATFESELPWPRMSPHIEPINRMRSRDEATSAILSSIRSPPENVIRTVSAERRQPAQLCSCFYHKSTGALDGCLRGFTPRRQLCTPSTAILEIGQPSGFANVVSFHPSQIDLPVSIANGGVTARADRIDGSIRVRSVREFGRHVDTRRSPTPTGGDRNRGMSLAR